MEESFREISLEDFVKEDSLEYFVENSPGNHFTQETTTKQSVEEDLAYQSSEKQSVDKDFSKQFEDVSGEYYTEAVPTEQVFKETQEDQAHLKMSDTCDSSDSKSVTCSSSSSDSDSECDRYGEAPCVHDASVDLSKVIVTQHFIDTANSIVQSAIQEHSKDHSSSGSTLRRTQEMESLYEPEETKGNHLLIKEEELHSASVPNLQSFYNDTVENKYETQQSAHELQAEREIHGASQQHEVSNWHHAHVNRPLRPPVDTVDPDHNTETTSETHSTWRQVHVSQPERSFHVESEEHKHLHDDTDAQKEDQHSTWHKVHVSTPARVFSEPLNVQHESEVYHSNTRVTEGDFSEPKDHVETVEKQKEAEHSVWHKTHINQPYRAPVPEVHPVENINTPASQEVHSVWKDTHVQRADESSSSYTGSYSQRYSNPPYHYSASESGKPVSPSEWREPEPLVPSGNNISSYSFTRTHQTEWNSDDSHSSDLPPDTEDKVRSELSTWLSSRKNQEEQEAQIHNIREESEQKSVPEKTDVHNEDSDEEWFHEEEETVYSVISTNEAKRIFNNSNYADANQSREFDSYSSYSPTVRQGFGYDRFKEIERETVQEENLQNRSTVRSSTDSHWKSPDSPWTSTYEKEEVQHSPRQIEIQSPHFSSEHYSSTRKESQDIPGIVLSTPPNEPPGSDEDYEIVSHTDKDIQQYNKDQEDNNARVQENTVSHQYSVTENTETRRQVQSDADVQIKVNQETHVQNSPVVSSSEYSYSERYTSIPNQSTETIDQSAESPVRCSPEKVFNRYEDDIVVEQPTPGPNQKVRIVYGSGYDYFKEIERTTLKEDRLGSGATIRASTDRGWQTPDSDGQLSPLPNFDSPSPVDRTKQWEPTPECRSPNPDYAYVPVKVSRTPSPTKEEPDYISHQESRDVSGTYPQKVESYHYSSSSESRNPEFKRSQFVDSPAFSPMSAEEEPKPLTPTKVQKSVRFHESTFESEETKKLDSPAPVPYSPVHSKIYVVDEKPQVPERTKVTGWEPVTQEEIPATKPPQSTLNYVPRNRELIFDETDRVDEDHELYKAKTFKEEREKLHDDYTDAWKKSVQIVEVRESPGKVDYEGRALPNRRFETHDDTRSKFVAEYRPQPQKVHARNEKVPSWRTSRGSESNDEPDHHHYANIADVDVHEHLRAEELARQQKLEERKGREVVTTTTIYGSIKSTNSSYSIDESEHIRRAVTEAAEKRVISVKIPRSPITTTPPSTPVTTEPVGSGPLPKLSRSVFKNLEKSVAQEELQHQGTTREYERALMEEKKRITEESLRYPGRRPKSQENLFTEYSETQMEDNQTGRKYFIDDVPKPKNVTFAPRQVKSSSDQFPNAEVFENEISQKETIP